MPSLEILIIPGAKLHLMSNEELKKLVLNNPRLRILDIADNGFINLPGEMFKMNANLEILNISSNKIHEIDLDLSYSTELRVIDLRNNLVMETISDAFLKSVAKITEMTHLDIILSGNNLKCDCNLLQLVSIFNVSTSAECNLNSENHLIDTNKNDSLSSLLKEACKSEQKLDLLIIIGGSSLFVLISGLIAVCCFIQFCRRRKLQNPGDWIITLAENTPKRDHVPTFIVFLAYCSHNSSFVMNTLYPRLNKKLMTLLNQHDKEKLIIAYDKKFLAGEAIDVLIHQAIENSYVTVAVISDEFLKSSWCSFEVKMAYTSNVPLIPLYLNKCNPDNLSGIFKLLYNTRVRLLWPDSKDLGRHDLTKQEEKVIDVLCNNVIAYVTQTKQQDINNGNNDINEEIETQM
ncbi:toll-like receptor 6 [Mya arenaria]|nr:toll-like receptor 6 [Mya arenaria]